MGITTMTKCLFQGAAFSDTTFNIKEYPKLEYIGYLSTTDEERGVTEYRGMAIFSSPVHGNYIRKFFTCGFQIADTRFRNEEGRAKIVLEGRSLKPPVLMQEFGVFRTTDSKKAASPNNEVLDKLDAIVERISKIEKKLDRIKDSLPLPDTAPINPAAPSNLRHKRTKGKIPS